MNSPNQPFSMMLKSGIKLLVIVFTLQALAGCGLASDNSAAQKTVENFYNALKSGNIPEAASYCTTDDKMTVEAWETLLENNINSMGKVTSFEKSSGFNVSQDNRVSTVSLCYTITYEDGKSQDSLKLSNSSGNFKIYDYNPTLTQAKYADAMQKATELTDSYYKALMQGDINSAMGYIGYAGIEKHNSAEWLNFYSYIEKQGGKIASFAIDNTASKSYLHMAHEETGMGNTYVILVNTTRNGKVYTEHIDLFQPSYTDPLKIVAHNID